MKKFLFILFSVVICSNAFAESMPIPVKLQSALFLKILSYDRKIKNDIKIAVLDGSNKSEIESSFQAVKGQKISGYSFSVSGISLSELSSMKANSIDILYVTSNNKAHISNIIKSSRSNGVLTITGIPEYVNDGLSVGIGIKNGKPDILVNLSSSKSEDHELSSQLLKLCTIVR